jgi:hypothetical protein
VPRRLVALGAGLAAVVTATAPVPTRAGCVCGEVASPPALLNACLARRAGECDAVLTAAADDALDRWRAFGRLYVDADADADADRGAGPRPGDGRNDVGLLATADIRARYGVDVAPWVLGVTFAPPVAGLIDGNATCPLPAGVTCPVYGDAPAHDVDVVLVAERRFTTDPLVAWASHLRGDAARTWDVAQVLEHELGHAHGLRHEDRVAALMNPFHLEFPGVTIMADDARTVRSAAPGQATDLNDLAVVGFAAAEGTFFGVSFGADAPAPLRPGVDRVRVTGFTVTNRGPRALPGVVTEIRVGGVAAGSLTCDLPAYGDCPLLDDAWVVLPALPGGAHALEIHVPPLNGEPLLADNTLTLGTLTVAGPPGPGPLPDAALDPDALGLDAAVDPDADGPEDADGDAGGDAHVDTTRDARKADDAPARTDAFGADPDPASGGRDGGAGAGPNASGDPTGGATKTATARPATGCGLATATLGPGPESARPAGGAAILGLALAVFARRWRRRRQKSTGRESTTSRRC